MKTVNTRVKSESGKTTYIKIPMVRAAALAEAGDQEGFSLEFHLKGTPWQGADLWKREDDGTTRHATLSEAKKLLHIQERNEAEEKTIVPPWEDPLDPPLIVEVSAEPVLWSVVTNEIYSDGSVKVRRFSGDEYQELQEEAPERAELTGRDGSWKRKFAFDYNHPAPGRPDALIGMPTAGQSPGYDERWGENLQLPLGWVLNRGSKTGEMYLSGYDKNGMIIFMEIPQVPSGDPTNTYTKASPEVRRG